MEIEKQTVTDEVLGVYATIPVRFEVTSILSPELINDGLACIVFREKTVNPPYTKGNDALETEEITRWTRSFDTSHWVLFLARQGNTPVVGATVAFRSPKVHMLRGREDITVLWDIRVHPDFRQSGIGTALFSEAANWSREQGCKYMKIETQDTNLPACRFYLKQGSRLGEINRFTYTDPRVSHETMLVWYLEL
ncbi:GNAT family N-acetyltransferase [Chloroflexota bacterium]